jgi:excinuclease ABC subunit C
MRSYSGEILYVGKAIDLLKRVSSYFAKRQPDPRILSMLSSVRVVDYVALKSEKDALLAEDRLIKRFQPKYNVALRDDKSYPYVKVTLDEKFPRICLVRQKNPKRRRGGARYFGPYHNAGEVKRLLRWLRTTFNICPCGRDVEKMKGCLYRHIEFCPAPCEGRITAQAYMKNVRKVLMFLEGRYGPLKRHLEREMRASSSRLDFERAAELRNNILAIDRMFEKISIREITEAELADRIETSRALGMLKEYLGLPSIPLTIEAFDISNISGTNPTGSSVVFSNGLPDKKDYRMYKIKSAPKRAADDYMMMKEVIARRYGRLAAEKRKLPDLVLVDGGKGQLGAAEAALDGLGLWKLPVAAIAKKDEEVFIPGREEPVSIPQDSPALLLLRQMRDEAHRFAVRLHRLRRGKAMTALFLAAAVPLAAAVCHAKPGKVMLKNGNCIYGDVNLNRDRSVTMGLKNGMMKIHISEIKKIVYSDGRNNPDGAKWSDANCDYDDAIIKCAYENGLSPALVKAVVHAESAFQSKSVSDKGAKGLMQLSCKNIRNFRIEDPFNPWHNISAGTRYLKLQIDRFGGDLDKALAAYNAGPNAVTKYGGVPPYKETREFVRNVKHFYLKYLELWKTTGRVHSFSDENGKIFFYNE